MVNKWSTNGQQMVNKWSTNGHQVIIHFHKLSSDFIHFHALSSIFIHYINFTHIHPLSSIFIHFIHFHPVPMGTFFSFWVPISVPRSPFSLIRAKERMKSLYSHYLMLTIWLVVITQLSLMNPMPVCQFWKRTISPPYRLYFIKLARLDQFCKHALFGSPFCWRGSPFSPHFTENWVPIGSPWHVATVDNPW